MKNLLPLLFCCLLTGLSTFSQTYFRSGIFLHHSTGDNIWGPNPDGLSTTTIPDQMHIFNTNHGLNGNDSISMEEEWWSPGDNEWATQHAFFEGDVSLTDINYYLDNYRILVVKSCFPSSAVESYGQEADTADPTFKSVFNYKWHWRHIISVMRDHPDNFFAIWTNAPLEPNSTDLSQALLSHQFCTWAKDTLFTGLDPLFGTFPENVYVFDYFHFLIGPDYMELPSFAVGAGDSHPNGYATDLVAPHFVNEIFEAALVYEAGYNGIKEGQASGSFQCYPNPVRKEINFSLDLNNPASLTLTLFNSLGQTIYQENTTAVKGRFMHHIDAASMAAGMMYYRLVAGDKVYVGKLVKSE